MPVDPQAEDGYQHIQNELVALVEAARGVAIRRVNALMTATYRQIGQRIFQNEQDGAQRACPWRIPNYPLETMNWIDLFLMVVCPILLR